MHSHAIAIAMHDMNMYAVKGVESGEYFFTANLFYSNKKGKIK